MVFPFVWLLTKVGVQWPQRHLSSQSLQQVGSSSCQGQRIGCCRPGVFSEQVTTYVLYSRCLLCTVAFSLYKQPCVEGEAGGGILVLQKQTLREFCFINILNHILDHLGQTVCLSLKKICKEFQSVFPSPPNTWIEKSSMFNVLSSKLWIVESGKDYEHFAFSV